ncbi:MAG TPA: type II secretion system protein [Candidatus Saccharimonadales bacterium]|nr:type II secretion system protein [Candidatus Saccharimonadales bacterium]
MALIQKIVKKRKQKGYTIIEVMIVLTISTALFATAIIGYTRQNQRTQFTNAVRDIELIVQDILNDVGTGYYVQSDEFVCLRSGSPAAPSLLSPPPPGVLSEQGTNQGCIFLGKAVNLRDTDSSSSFTAHTIVGLRNHANNEEDPSTNVENAANRTIPFEGTYDRYSISGSLDIPKIITSDETEVAGFAVVSGFGNGSLADGGAGGAGATTNQVSIASIDRLYDFNSTTSQVVGSSDLNKDITICIREAGEGRRASITIGAGAQANVQTTIDSWPDGCET